MCIAWWILSFFFRQEPWSWIALPVSCLYTAHHITSSCCGMTSPTSVFCNICGWSGSKSESFVIGWPVLRGHRIILIGGNKIPTHIKAEDPHMALFWRSVVHRYVKMKFGILYVRVSDSQFLATNTINITTREKQMICEKFWRFVSSKDVGTGAQMNICTQYGQMYICRLFPFFNTLGTGHLNC
jgi:hypothetical protein